MAIPAESVERALSAFENIAGAVTASEDRGQWQVTGYFETKPKADDLFPLLEAYQVAVENFIIKKLPEKDWLAENRKTFEPLEVGSFFIHATDYKGALPTGKITLAIDAAQAFGTGRHATTRGCLMLLEKYKAEAPSPRKILDLGCGTAILAMAASRLFESQIIAADNDILSVKHATENVLLNKCTSIQCVESDGFKNEQVMQGGPYDLIFANILAEVLIDLAPQIRAHLVPEGIVILSGILDDQVASILKAYHPLREVARYEEDAWRALMLA